MKLLIAVICLSLFAAFTPSRAADLVEGPYNVIMAPDQLSDYPVYRGRAVALDGRTIRFPDSGAVVQLMDLDACELPQWAFVQNSRRPVPCGGFAKAWLKRLIGQTPVACHVATIAADGMPLAYCFRGKSDLGLRMLAKGWARVATPKAQCPLYFSAQTKAQSAGYGMWKDRVLDMQLWRDWAKDKTLARRPIADYDLIFAALP